LVYGIYRINLRNIIGGGYDILGFSVLYDGFFIHASLELEFIPFIIGVGTRVGNYNNTYNDHLKHSQVMGVST